MATKLSKSAGNDSGYLAQAAKLCVYPIDIPGRFISIPENELDTDDLMVAHLVKQYGFKIQSSIPLNIAKNEIYNPVLGRRLFPDYSKQIPIAESKFKVEENFRVLSTLCELQITYIQSGRVHLKYTNRNKPVLILSQDQLSKNISMGLWQPF